MSSAGFDMEQFRPTMGIIKVHNVTVVCWISHALQSAASAQQTLGVCSRRALPACLLGRVEAKLPLGLDDVHAKPFQLDR